MSQSLQESPSADVERETLASVLRDRALDATPSALLLQLTGGLALNAASLWWHPDAWPVPVLTGVTLVAHAVWAFAVQRDAREEAAHELDDDALVDDADDATEGEAADADTATEYAVGWVRRASAGVGVLSLLGLLAVLGVGLLGHLQS